MSIVILANETLSLHLIRFGNVVDRNQLFALYGAHERRRDWAGADTVHVIDSNADLSSVASEDLDALRARYRVLHTSIEFFLLRRSAWVCLAPKVRALAEYWLRDRHSRDGQGAELILVDGFEQLGGLFLPEELDVAASEHGFVELWSVGRAGS